MIYALCQKFLDKMVTETESRLTILAVISFSITFWLFVSVLINIFLGCSLNDESTIQLGLRNENPQKDYPFTYHFVVALILKTHKKNSSDLRLCDATVLNPFWTITAAHCLAIYQKAKKYHIKIKSNSHDWKTGQEHRIQKYLIHQKYLQNQTNYDISLIKTIEPIIGSKVSYIKIARFDYDYVNSSAWVISWSIQSIQNNSETRELKKNPLLLVEDDYCLKTELREHGILSCAVIDDGGSTFCSYGSGAPVIQDRKLVGVVLKEAQCSREFPGVFIKVSVFQKSIEEILNHEDMVNGTEFVSVVL